MCDHAKYYSWWPEGTTSNRLWNKPLNGNVWRKLASSTVLKTATRDHMDLGSSICTLGGVGAAHHFHTRNIDPNALLEPDDPYTTYISWPNFHSGANGDYQEIHVNAPAHPVLANPASPTGVIRYLPAHPHEGAVSAPANQEARV